jgi:hypothetical protein
MPPALLARPRPRQTPPDMPPSIESLFRLPWPAPRPHQDLIRPLIILWSAETHFPDQGATFRRRQSFASKLSIALRPNAFTQYAVRNSSVLPHASTYNPLTDLFHESRQKNLARAAPLAVRMRPRTLEEFVGRYAARERPGNSKSLHVRSGSSFQHGRTVDRVPECELSDSFGRKSELSTSPGMA